MNNRCRRDANLMYDVLSSTTYGIGGVAYIDAQAKQTSYIAKCKCHCNGSEGQGCSGPGFGDVVCCPSHLKSTNTTYCSVCVDDICVLGWRIRMTSEDKYYQPSIGFCKVPGDPGYVVPP